MVRALKLIPELGFEVMKTSLVELHGLHFVLGQVVMIDFQVREAEQVELLGQVLLSDSIVLADLLLYLAFVAVVKHG